MLYILGRLSLLLAMAHHERAIRLLADHLGFSIVHSALLTASDMADIVALNRSSRRRSWRVPSGNRARVKPQLLLLTRAKHWDDY
jgi:hypothetical protein